MVLLWRKSFNQLLNSLFQCNLSKYLTSCSEGSHILLLCAVPHSQPRLCPAQGNSDILCGECRCPNPLLVPFPRSGECRGAVSLSTQGCREGCVPGMQLRRLSRGAFQALGYPCVDSPCPAAVFVPSHAANTSLPIYLLPKGPSSSAKPLWDTPVLPEGG